MMLISIPVIINLEKSETLNPLCFAIAYSSIIPLIIAAIYTMIFFSRIFREDTLVNLTLTGHSKKEVFAASWIYSVTIVTVYLILYAVEALIAVNILYKEFKTDTGLFFLFFGGSFLLCIFFMTLTTSLLFVSRNAIMTVIVTVIIAYLSVTVPIRLTYNLVYWNTMSHNDIVRLNAYVSEGKEISYKFDPADLRIYTIVDGEAFECEAGYDPDILTGNRRTVAKTVFYAMPTSFYFLTAYAVDYEVTDPAPIYLSYAVPVLYTAVIMGLGLHLFSRRDI